MNVLKLHGILPGPMGRTAKDVRVYVGNSAFPILATAGGLVEFLVKLNDRVEVGQKVAIQRNSFGEMVAEYASGVAGEVAGLRSDAMSEPGNPLAFILHHRATPDGRGFLSRVGRRGRPCSPRRLRRRRVLAGRSIAACRLAHRHVQNRPASKVHSLPCG